MAIAKEDEPQGDPNGTFGDRLQSLRQQHGLPARSAIAAYVAEKTGRSCSPQWVSALIRNENDRRPGMDQLEAFAGFFGESPVIFFGDPYSQRLLNKQAFLEAWMEFQQLTTNAQDPAAEARIAVYTRAYSSCHPDDLPTMTKAVRELIDMFTEHTRNTPGGPPLLPPQSAETRP